MAGLASAQAQQARYTAVAIWFHWIIAVLIVSNIAIAELTEDLARPERGEWMAIHKPIGILILVLTVGRILWRLGHKPPAQPATMKSWEVMLSKFTHGLFYFLMLALPLSGWLWMSALDPARPVDMFGLFQWPALPFGANELLADIMHEGHEVMGKVMFYLVILHVLAALKHHFIDKDGLIGRLNPFGKA